MPGQRSPRRGARAHRTLLPPRITIAASRLLGSVPIGLTPQLFYFAPGGSPYVTIAAARSRRTPRSLTVR
jgi:hypothetical protein